MNFTVQLSSDFDRLHRDLSTMDSRFRQQVAHATNDIVAITHDDAVLDTPLEFGPLREDSEGSIDDTVISHGTIQGAVQNASIATVGNIFTGKIGYKQIYAPIQHENLDFKHSFGKAKFLEGACVNAESGNVARWAMAFDKL